MPLRPVLSAACFAALVIVSVRIPPLTLPFIDREPIHQAMTRQADPGAWWPDYPRFIEAVRRRTAPGDSIAILVPPQRWEGGYTYPYYRASYILAGREVLPLIAPDNRRLPENFKRAKYIAIWPAKPLPGTQVVLTEFHGALVRR